MEGDDQIPFGPPPPEEKLPLVVPDNTPSIERRVCKGTAKKTGLPCSVPPVHGKDYCMGHALDPVNGISKETRAEWRALSANKQRVRRKFTVSLKGDVKPKTIPEVLLILSKRIDLCVAKFGDVADPAVDEILCDLARTYVAVYKCGSDEAAAGIASHWTLKRRQA